MKINEHLQRLAKPALAALAAFALKLLLRVAAKLFLRYQRKGHHHNENPTVASAPRQLRSPDSKSPRRLEKLMSVFRRRPRTDADDLDAETAAELLRQHAHEPDEEELEILDDVSHQRRDPRDPYGNLRRQMLHDLLKDAGMSHTQSWDHELQQQCEAQQPGFAARYEAELAKRAADPAYAAKKETAELDRDRADQAAARLRPPHAEFVPAKKITPAPHAIPRIPPPPRIPLLTNGAPLRAEELELLRLPRKNK